MLRPLPVLESHNVQVSLLLAKGIHLDLPGGFCNVPGYSTFLQEILVERMVNLACHPEDPGAPFVQSGILLVRLFSLDKFYWPPSCTFWLHILDTALWILSLPLAPLQTMFPRVLESSLTDCIDPILTYSFPAGVLVDYIYSLLDCPYLQPFPAN